MAKPQIPAQWSRIPLKSSSDREAGTSSRKEDAAIRGCAAASRSQDLHSAMQEIPQRNAVSDGFLKFLPPARDSTTCQCSLLVTVIEYIESGRLEETLDACACHLFYFPNDNLTAVNKGHEPCRMCCYGCLQEGTDQWPYDSCAIHTPDHRGTIHTRIYAHSHLLQVHGYIPIW